MTHRLAIVFLPFFWNTVLSLILLCGSRPQMLASSYVCGRKADEKGSGWEWVLMSGCRTGTDRPIAAVSSVTQQGAYPLLSIFWRHPSPHKKSSYKWLFWYFSKGKSQKEICKPQLLFNAFFNKYWMFSALLGKQKERYKQPIFRLWNIASRAASNLTAF